MEAMERDLVPGAKWVRSHDGCEHVLLDVGVSTAVTLSPPPDLLDPDRPLFGIPLTSWYGPIPQFLEEFAPAGHP